MPNRPTGDMTGQPGAASQLAKKEVVRANLLVYVDPRGPDGARPSVSYCLERQARHSSLTNVAQVYLLGRCGAIEGRSVDDAAFAHLGYHLSCPDGGTYTYDPKTGTVACSVHGSLYSPQSLPAPPPGKLLESVDRVIAALRFTPDGLETALEICR